MTKQNVHLTKSTIKDNVNVRQDFIVYGYDSYTIKIY